MPLDEQSADPLYARITWRILPILLAAYIVAYIDRVNVGFARLQMMGDLKFNDSIYGLGAGIFFLGYFLFEIPGNLLLHRIGARVWISRILITWGIVSACTAFVRTPAQFYTARFLLGVAESGFFPGMILYLTYWFPSHRRARIVALLLTGFPLSGILGGPISGAILHSLARVHHLAGWQWLFLLEAIPALLVGALVPLLLADRPHNAPWLSSDEKTLILADIAAESSTKPHHSIASVFRSPVLWLLGAIYFGMQTGSYAIGFWLPTVIRQTGVANELTIGLLTAGPFTLALLCMILTGRHSDRTRERRWHVILPNLAAAAGFLLCTRAGSSTPIAMAGLTLAVTGVVTALPIFWSLPTAFLAEGAAAAGIALVNCLGNLGGFFSPTLIGYLETRTGTLNSGLYLVAACLAASSLLILTHLPAKQVNR